MENMPNWTEQLGEEISEVKLAELDSLIESTSKKIKEEETIADGLTKLLKGYERINDTEGILNTNNEIKELKTAIETKNKMVSAMQIRRNEISTRLATIGAAATAEVVSDQDKRQITEPVEETKEGQSLFPPFTVA